MVVPVTHRYGVRPYVGVKGDDMDAEYTSGQVPGGAPWDPLQRCSP